MNDCQAALRERLSVPQATREFVRILRLHEDYSEGIIAQALEKALECHSAGDQSKEASDP